VRPFRIAPSVLSADFGRLAEEVQAAERAGADWIHVDVMDGHFVPNLTIGPDIVATIGRQTRLPLDVHLMVAQPERWLERYVEAGSAALTVHVEACPHLHRVLGRIRELGARAGVALNPGTPAVLIEPVLGDVDLVLVMTVNPGFSGQGLIESVLPKAAAIRQQIRTRGLDVDLAVDGGVDLENIANVAVHGGNAFVMGSAFFKSDDYKRVVDTARARLAPYAAQDAHDTEE
jgi:ribulose-phosphate 3-epimerase